MIGIRRSWIALMPLGKILAMHYRNEPRTGSLADLNVVKRSPLLAREMGRTERLVPVGANGNV